MIEYKKSKILKRTPESVLIELDESINWMKSMDLNISPTRIVKYRRFISKVLDSDKKFDDFSEYKDYLFTSKELEEFLRVADVFSQLNDETLLDKVKSIISGKAFRHEIQQSKSDPSRNYLHELSIAARFLNAGYDVNISGDCDVVVDTADRIIFVECKRIRSHKQILKRVGRASDQVKTRIGQKQKSKKIGYITLDLTDIFSTENIHEFKSLDEIRDYHYQILHKFSLENRPQIQTKINKNIYAVILNFHVLAILNNTDEFGIFNIPTFYIMSFDKGKNHILDFNKEVLGKFANKA